MASDMKWVNQFVTRALTKCLYNKKRSSLRNAIKMLQRPLRGLKYFCYHIETCGERWSVCFWL